MSEKENKLLECLPCLLPFDARTEVKTIWCVMPSLEIHSFESIGETDTSYFQRYGGNVLEIKKEGGIYGKVFPTRDGAVAEAFRDHDARILKLTIEMEEARCAFLKFKWAEQDVKTGDKS